MIKAIIFDFDGVLVESVDIKTRAFANLFESEGDENVKKVVDYHLKHAGVSRFEKFRYFYSNIFNRHLTEEVFEVLCQRFSELVVDEVVNASFVNGALDFLENKSKLFKCFVASGTPQNEIEEIAKRKDISNYFIRIYGAPRKKTDIVKEILNIHELLPEEVVCIGDAMSDYEAARSNSVEFIARLDNNEEIFAPVDCVKVRDLTCLIDVLN
jgi:HAD superfamily hydrolase (TIGR01549 family)